MLGRDEGGSGETYGGGAGMERGGERRREAADGGNVRGPLLPIPRLLD